MTIRDSYKLSITMNKSKERNNVNNLSYSAQYDSKRSSQVRGSKISQNNNKGNDCSSSCIGDHFNLTKFDRASEIRDSRLSTKDSIHSNANEDRSNSCKYEYKVAAKENLVPDKTEQADSAFSTLGSIERRGKRYRNESTDGSNSEAVDDFSERISNDSAGTSRDGLKELSFSSVNQRHLNNQNNYMRTIRKIKMRRRKSQSSYFDQSLRCRVSIDLTRIQSFFDSSLLIKKRNLYKIRSCDDLKICSTIENKIRPLNTLRRSKSESNITSFFANKCFDNYFNGIKLIDLQKYCKRKKRKIIDKHNCVR